MADNVYLLETRLSPAQQVALGAVRDVARGLGLTVFLVGGAVRDLMSGSPVRDLDFAVQGPVQGLRPALEEAGGVFSGEVAERQALFLRFPSGVRVEVASTLAVTYPKPGKPEYSVTTILEDLRRRDFTANAMALSLNDGSYGLLMDPLNGVADIENRELRLVSNYGFIEDPARMIRAARLMARLGWQMEDRTRSRYETGKEENYIAALGEAERDYELEEVFHEEDALRVMRRLEEEGWLGVLSPVLGVAKANVAELGRLREVQMQFQTRGVSADAAAANFPLLTAKLEDAEVEEIRARFPRAGFVGEIEGLEVSAKELVARVLSKEMGAPSAVYRFFLDTPPSTVVYAAYSSRSGAFQSKVKGFLTEWPTAQSRIPHALMLEMRITPELPGYGEMVEQLFYALMDGKLESTEEMRAFLEPYSPPAPPPPVSLRRPRSPRKEAKSKSKKKAAAAVEQDGTELSAEGAGEEQRVDLVASEDADGEVEASGKPAKGPAKKPVKAAAVVEAKDPEQKAIEPKTTAVKTVPPAVAAKTSPAVAAKTTAAGSEKAPNKAGAKLKDGAKRPTEAPANKAVAAKGSATDGVGRKAGSEKAPPGKAAPSKAVPQKKAAKGPVKTARVTKAGAAAKGPKRVPAPAAKALAKRVPEVKGKTKKATSARPTAMAKKPVKKAAAKVAPARRPAAKPLARIAAKEQAKPKARR